MGTLFGMTTIVQVHLHRPSLPIQRFSDTLHRSEVPLPKSLILLVPQTLLTRPRSANPGFLSLSTPEIAGVTPNHPQEDFDFYPKWLPKQLPTSRRMHRRFDAFSPRNIKWSDTRFPNSPAYPH
jgi:hypothetical protein